MNKVELIYDQTCPNVAATRANLLLAFSKLGMMPDWDEWERDAAESPAYTRGFGSPSILVNGKDIAGEATSSDANSCRVYLNASDENKGVPPLELITLALASSTQNKGASAKAGILGGVALGPGIFTAILAKAACPLCYPAIAGLLSSVGLGFLFTGTYMLALTAALLGIVLFGLGYRAHERRGYAPLAIGAIAALVVMLDRLTLTSDPILYLGIAGLTAASIWNLIPKKVLRNNSCSSCVTSTSESE
jgi:mercuric ion transport protein